MNEYNLRNGKYFYSMNCFAIIFYLLKQKTVRTSGFKLKVFFFLFLLTYSKSFSQVGGRNSYEFIDVPTSAHAAAVGGQNISLSDINMYFQNPALLNESMHKTLSLNFAPYYAGISNNSVAYVHNFSKLGLMGIGMQYFNYGEIQMTDNSSTDLGITHPKEYAISVSKTHKIDHFTLGVTGKFAASQIVGYNSYAALADIGGLFKHPTKEFTLGLAIKNAGFALNKYTSNTKVNMPFDVQVGTSYKPEHMPLRVSLTAHHLQRFDIVYEDPNKKGLLDANGQEIKVKTTFTNKLIRHFVIGGEFLLSKNFQVRFGYNFLRRRELRLVSKSGGAGLSFGFMVKVKSFEFGFTRSYYHVAGGTSFITLNTNFSTLFKKKTIAPSSN